ncbi:MAG TPA: response regulator transcription factor [Chloroflexota bacterium]|nr:response regulator transcription factor [Chloroflexota bacterium]
MSQERVLIVDDEPIVTDVVLRYLAREGYQVTVASDGETALSLARAEGPDLIVLDLMLPRLDGLEVCRRLRSESSVPIIMLTAKGEESDKILGLGLGADDYLTKPFSPGELVARVGAVLRRTRAGAGQVMPDDIVKVGQLRISPRARSVERDGQPIHLTAKEFDLLYFLAKNAGQVFTREQLLNNVWDYDWYGDASTVTVHIRRLREKVELQPMRPRYIKTVWGIGYKFEP